MCGVESIELLEATVVEDLLERAVEVAADVALVVADEALAVFGRVRLPLR